MKNNYVLIKKGTYQNTEQNALYYKKQKIPIYCI